MGETRIGGIVLCGGHSARMGRPKEWLPVGDETLLQRTVRIVGEVCEKIVVAGRTDQPLPPLPESILVVGDQFPEVGPVAGIEAGLRALRESCRIALVVACDHPRLDAGVLRRLLEAIGEHRAVVVKHDGILCPLLGVYPTQLADQAGEFLRRGERAARRFAQECQAAVISSETFRDLDPELHSFINVNDPTQLDAACRLRKP